MWTSSVQQKNNSISKDVIIFVVISIDVYCSNNDTGQQYVGSTSCNLELYKYRYTDLLLTRQMRTY